MNEPHVAAQFDSQTKHAETKRLQISSCHLERVFLVSSSFKMPPGRVGFAGSTGLKCELPISSSFYSSCWCIDIQSHLNSTLSHTHIYLYLCVYANIIISIKQAPVQNNVIVIDLDPLITQRFPFFMCIIRKYLCYSSLLPKTERERELNLNAWWKRVGFFIWCFFIFHQTDRCESEKQELAAANCFYCKIHIFLVLITLLMSRGGVHHIRDSCQSWGRIKFFSLSFFYITLYRGSLQYFSVSGNVTLRLNEGNVRGD